MCVPTYMHPDILRYALIEHVLGIYDIYFTCDYTWLTMYAHLFLIYTHVPSLHMCYI